MWDKPGELTNYPDEGFEIPAFAQTVQGAVEGWKTSESHYDIIVNRGIWEDHHWRGLGVGIDAGYAHVWFGTAEDPDEF